MADPNLSRPSQQAVGGYEPYQSYSQKSSIPWYHSSLKPFLSSGGSLMPKVLSGMSGRGFILDFSTTLTGELLRAIAFEKRKKRSKFQCLDNGNKECVECISISCQ